MSDNQENKPYPLVYIEWKDSISDTGRWTTADHAVEWGKDESVIQQVGYVLDETGDYMILTPILHYTEGDANVCFLMKVHKSSIVKVIHLDEAVKKDEPTSVSEPQLS